MFIDNNEANLVFDSAPLVTYRLQKKYTIGSNRKMILRFFNFEEKFSIILEISHTKKNDISDLSIKGWVHDNGEAHLLRCKIERQVGDSLINIF